MSTAFERLKAKTTGMATGTTPVSDSFSPDISRSAFERIKLKGTTPSVVPHDEEKGSAVSGFLKSVVSAPATLIARPFQAAAELAGADANTVDEYTRKLTGGIVASVPREAGDVVKDVGRGVQTVAMGTAAPLAGGAAFGFGGALENQGSDIFSKEGVSDALVSTLVGMGAGKAVGLIGKPLLNAAGKVIGTITPKILQDVAGKGSQAVANFMAHHEIVPSAVKPAINAIPKVAEKFDDSVNTLFRKGGQAVSGAFKSQYPNALEKGQQHYENAEVNRLFEPTKKSDSAYRNARTIYNQAKQRGIDLEQVAKENKIYGMDNIDEGKFATEDTINALRDEAMSGGKEFLRPALKAAEPGVERVPLARVRAKMVEKVMSTPNATLSPDQKAKFVREIMKEYGDDSVTAKLYKDGLALTDLYDSKLQTVSGVYKKPRGGVSTISDALTSTKKRLESQAFDDIFRETAPKELGLDDYFKAQEARFLLADYLESLGSKKAPQTLFQRGVKRASQLAGATTGANVAGPFGMFSGYQFGGIVADTFASLPNPVKVAYLNSIKMKPPQIYQVMKNYVSDAEAAALSRMALPEPTTIYMGPTQKGKSYTPATTDTSANTVGGLRQRKSIKDFLQ